MGLSPILIQRRFLLLLIFRKSVIVDDGRRRDLHGIQDAVGDESTWFSGIFRPEQGSQAVGYLRGEPRTDAGVGKTFARSRQDTRFGPKHVDRRCVLAFFLLVARPRSATSIKRQTSYRVSSPNRALIIVKHQRMRLHSKAFLKHKNQAVGPSISPGNRMFFVVQSNHMS